MKNKLEQKTDKQISIRNLKKKTVRVRKVSQWVSYHGSTVRFGAGEFEHGVGVMDGESADNKLARMNETNVKGTD